MSCRPLRWLLMFAVAIVSIVSAPTLNAQPFSPSVADIQGLGDSTAAENFSSIDAINVTPDGIQLDVTWRVGQNTDPFGEFFGQNFPRIGLSLFTNSEEGGLGRNLTTNDGIQWTIRSDRNLFAQPFIQTAPDWTFYEPSPGGYGVAGDLANHTVTLDFNDARNFSGREPANIVHPDANSEIRANAFGLQIVGPDGLTPGQSQPGQIWITTVIPEPTTGLLLMMGVMAMLPLARRRPG